MINILYVGDEGFTIPEPPRTKRGKKSPPRFEVQQDVGEEMRHFFHFEDELQYINREMRPNQKAYIIFGNLSIPACTFEPNEVTEVNEETYEALIQSRWWREAPGEGDAPVPTPKPPKKPKPNEARAALKKLEAEEVAAAKKAAEKAPADGIF